MNVLEWDFLEEPLYRWFLWLVAMSIFAGLWSTVLSQVRGAVS